MTIFKINFLLDNFDQVPIRKIYSKVNKNA